MTRRPTINDIAQECGVSLSTVSLVLNNNPRISEKTRSKVLDAVNKFGYQPNVQARALASRSSRSISVVVPHLNHVFADIYFGEIVSGIYDRASEDEYKVLLDIANEKFIQSKEYLNLLKSRRVDGMLFIASSLEDEYLREFEGTSHPFLLVNHFFPGSSLNYIAIDYKDSAQLAAQHLLELGHRQIGTIAGTNTHTGIQFRDTFIESCKLAGCAENDLPWADGGKEWSEEGGFKAAEELLRANPSLTAIMASNDRMAIGAMRYLATQGKRIPEDISVMGVDDISPAKFATPGLTTIHHRLYDMGRKACEVILGLFKEEVTSCQEVMSVELVKRESTAAPRS